MRQLAARGISMIYISRRLVEIFEQFVRVSIFRDGRGLATAESPSIAPDSIVNHMVGRVMGKLYPRSRGGGGLPGR